MLSEHLGKQVCFSLFLLGDGEEGRHEVRITSHILRFHIFAPLGVINTLNYYQSFTLELVLSCIPLIFIEIEHLYICILIVFISFSEFSSHVYCLLCLKGSLNVILLMKISLYIMHIKPSPNMVGNVFLVYRRFEGNIFLLSLRFEDVFITHVL